jgi:hypothetical protein
VVVLEGRECRSGEPDLLTFRELSVDLDHHSAISNIVYGENQTDEGAPLTCKKLRIGRKVNGTRVDDWPMFGVEGPRNTEGEDEGAAMLVRDFRRLLRASTGGVVVG